MSVSQLTLYNGPQFVPIGTAVAHQFPEAHFNDVDVRNGTVKVVARAPSGQTRALNINLDANGQYKTDFTPNEVGDWTISLLYHGRHIQGSPFNVRVQDPNRVRVYGIQEQGRIGQEVSFCVDATDAGEGELSVEVHYLGQLIAAKIAQRGNQFDVAFLPEGTGAYTVCVSFDRMVVPGSPFVVNVVNPTVVSASGDGLRTGKVGQKSTFIINAFQDASSNVISVRVKSPHGSLIPATVTEIGAGSFNVEFVPCQVGDHTIDVLFHDTAVNGSPFICHVYDASQIIVTGLQERTVVGKSVEFFIDASDSGKGRMEILINDGQVPNKVENIGDHQFKASFTPTLAVPHTIQVVFNDHEVTGSPWVIDVVNADNVHTTANLLHLLPVGNPASFEIHTEIDGDIQVKITNMLHGLVPVCITKLSVGTYAVEFTPTEIGQLNITITYEGLVVPGSPFICYAYNSSAITVSSIPAVAAGENVEFTIDARNAGHGDLTILIDNGNVPASVRSVGQNVYSASFIPTKAGLYSVELFFNDRPVKDSPFTVAVVDSSFVTVQFSSPLIPTGQLAVLRVNTQSAGTADLTARVTSPSCRDVTVQVKSNGTSAFTIEFTPSEPGAHEVQIEYGGKSIPCSPLIMMAYDVSRIKVMGIRDGMIGCPGKFVVDLNKCGEGELDVCVLSTLGHPVVNEIRPIEPGRLEVLYTPTEAGIHFAEITFNDEHVTGSPFKFNVLDAQKVRIRGDGLNSVECNKLATFIIVAPEAQLSDLEVIITAPNGRQLSPSLSETKPFNYLVEYTPSIAGIYSVDIRYHDCGIPGNPFSVQCWDASRVLMANIKQCEVGCDSFFNVEMADAGDGTIEISIAGPSGQLIPNEVVTASQGLLEVHFIPSVSGIHRATVTYNGTAIPGSPAQFNVVDTNNVIVRGEGLGLVQCSHAAFFMVCAPDAQMNDIDVAIIAPSGKHLIPDLKESSKGNCRIEYVPTTVGTHEIRIACFGKEIKGSPFAAKVWDASRVLLADVSMGRVGIESAFKVIVGDAGEGVLEVTLTDPSGHLIPNQAQPVESGVLEVVFIPKMAGVHRGCVTFNREKVPGSPFSFLVIDAFSVSCWGDGLNNVAVKKLTSFTITAPQAQLKDVGVRILGPTGSDVLSRVIESGNCSFRVDYTPQSAGVHLVSVTYFGELIPICPLTVHAWDISKVLVSPINLAFVGVQSQFTVDSREAGQGKLDVTISGTQGQRLVCDVQSDKQGAHLVSYIPTVAGLHRADVLFNDQIVSGSPFTFTVADPENVSVSGNGIDSVRCNKVASFIITSPAAKRTDLFVKITGPNRKQVHHRIFESGSGIFTVEYTPTLPGDHNITVKYFECLVRGSPFIANAWDPAGVILVNVRPGVICRLHSFSINALNAGDGSLEISVQCRGETIPNTARSDGKTGSVDVTFIPKYVEPHYVNVRFNGELVPGSPFVVPIIDGSVVTASGPGLGHPIAYEPTVFNVATGSAGGESELAVNIISPTNRQVDNVSIDGSAAGGFVVNYTPFEAGCYTVNVKYAEIPIKDSPFLVEVFDPRAVLIIGQISPVGRVNKPVSVRVDASRAGRGTISAQAKGPSSQPGVTISSSNDGFSALSFVPIETGEHLLFISFNNINIQGSPFLCTIIDPKNLLVNWDAIHLRSIGQPIEILLRSDDTLVDQDIHCTVSDPYGRPVPVAHAAKDRVHGFMFIGEDVGPHVVNLDYGSESVPGSPYTCYVYDAQRVKVVDVSPCVNIGEEITFIVDTTEAGMGDIDVEVTQGTVGIPVHRQSLCNEQHRFCFIATSPKDYFITVTFNSQQIPVSPLVVRALNPVSKMSLSNGNATRFVPVGQTVWAVVCPPGHPVFPQDVTAVVTAVSGELLPVTVTQQSDGGIKLEYRSMFTGAHCLDVSFAGQQIPGSPIVTEIFDVSKVQIEGTKSSRVGEPVVLDVNRVHAGEAELNVTITDSSGCTLPFEVDLNDFGETISYVPLHSGTHTINVTYGGLNIPGCPVRQEIVDIPCVTARGSGLEHAVVDRLAEFIVDVKGERGELIAEVQGPNSFATCTIEPEAGGLLRVSYIPVEVGIFTIILHWNGNLVQGTPCHPKVVDPTKVVLVNCYEQMTDYDRLKVQVGELQNLVFDCKNAGPGQFRACVEESSGDIGADVISISAYEYAVKFVPRKEGDYFIRIYWNNLAIDKFPIIATAEVKVEPPTPVPPCIPMPEPPQIRADLVSVQGPGLSTARVFDPTDFIVDGHEGGPGILDIQLTGLKCDVDVICVPLSDCVFGCTYVPELAGAYLLSVLWSGQHVPGSPFKVSVLSCSDASKVVCSGDGLTSAVMGKEASILIDCRRAGCGEILAKCSGPTRMAYSSLIDRHDGTFELVIKPLEVGPHLLEISYDDEPIPRSPFNVKVTAAPDASKVKVSGEGICDGILATFQSSFIVDTRGAGPGQLTVKVRGPKGAFRVEMKRMPDSDRVITCRYHPTEIGEYWVYVLWSGQHVIGSPFHVNIVDSIDQLRQLSRCVVPAAYNNSLRMSTLSGNGLTFSDDF